jgi:ribonuclease E
MSTKDTPSQGTSSTDAGSSQAPADVFDPFSAPSAANAAPADGVSGSPAETTGAAGTGPSGDTPADTADVADAGQETGRGDATSSGTEQESAPEAAGADTSNSADSAATQQASAPAAADPMNMLFQAPDLASITPARAPRQSSEDDDSDDENQGSGSRRSSSRRNGSSGRGGSGQQSDSGGQRDAAHRSDDDSSGEKGSSGKGSSESQSSDSQNGDTRADADDSSSSSDQGESEDHTGGSRKSRRKRRRGGGRSKNRADGDAAAESPSADSASAGGGKGSSAGQRDSGDDDASDEDSADENSDQVIRKRRRRRRGDVDMEVEGGDDESTHTVTRVRAPREGGDSATSDKVTGLKGSTRLEAKRQRRRASREGGRRRQIVTEAEFLARRESVDRKMIVRQREDRIQIGVLEDGVLAEHFVSNTTQDSLIGNVYLGKVQNVLPSMEAAFVDIGRGRNAVLYAGEVDWSAANLGGSPRKIENALKSGDSVLVQVTKDPVGHKGARLTSQVSLPGRYLVFVPGGSMTGISRKLPDTERARLKKILKEQMPEDSGVIVRTAAEGASEEELTHDINRLRALWETIQSQRADKKVLAPELLYSEPDLTIKVVRDVFNEDFSSMEIQGEETWDNIEAYVTYVAPHLLDRLHRWDNEDQDRGDIFAHHRIDEQLNKALDRKVNLPSGGSLVFDRTEAMTVVDVNTGKFTGSGGNLEETVTRNNLEAAEEIVRQLRLRDIGGIIVMDFIDMVLESNRDLVLRRLGIGRSTRSQR